MGNLALSVIIVKEKMEVHFKALSQYTSGRADGNHKELQSADFRVEKNPFTSITAVGMLTIESRRCMGTDSKIKNIDM
jgi:hypothetical protein